MLVIDCCIRGEESATRKYYEAYLRNFSSASEIEIVNVSELGLEPLNAETLAERNELIEQDSLGDKIFNLAHQFKNADEIIIAAPYWDLLFPAALKVYFEHICVPKITMGYSEFGEPVGLCRAKRLMYFTTCGGYTNGMNLGYEYVRSLAEMLGINDCSLYSIEGMDTDPSLRDEVLEQGIDSIRM